MENQEKNLIDKRIGNKVKAAMKRARVEMTQRKLASELGITEVTISQMLSGVAPLPLERFFQMVAILKPTREDVNEIFRLYQEKFSFPDDAFALIDCGWVQKRYAELQVKGAENLSEINKKEIEVIQYWNSGMSEAVPAEPEDAKQQLLEYVGKLNADESARALMALKGFFGEK